MSAIAKVLNKFYQALQPLGYLLTGHAELHGQNLERFQVKSLPESLIFQRPKATTVNEISQPPSQPAAPPSKIAISQSAPPPSNLPLPNPPLPNPPIRQSLTAIEQLQRAQISIKNKAFGQALQQVEQALEQQPDNRKAICLMAEIHTALNHTQTAIHYCYEALKPDSYFIAPYYLLAKNFAAQGNFSAAKRTLRKIIYLEPSAVIAYLKLSQLYQQEGNPQKSDLMRHLAFKIFKQHLHNPD